MLFKHCVVHACEFLGSFQSQIRAPAIALVHVVSEYCHIYKINLHENHFCQGNAHPALASNGRSLAKSRRNVFSQLPTVKSCARYMSCLAIMWSRATKNRAYEGTPESALAHSVYMHACMYVSIIANTGMLVHFLLCVCLHTSQPTTGITLVMNQQFKRAQAPLPSSFKQHAILLCTHFLLHKHICARRCKATITEH
jgi:hypothetical protein